MPVGSANTTWFLTANEFGDAKLMRNDSDPDFFPSVGEIVPEAIVSAAVGFPRPGRHTVVLVFNLGVSTSHIARALGAIEGVDRVFDEVMPRIGDFIQPNLTDAVRHLARESFCAGVAWAKQKQRAPADRDQQECGTPTAS